MYRDPGEPDLFIDIAVLVKAIDRQAQICQMFVDELDRVGESMLRFSQSRPIVSYRPAFFPAWMIDVAQHQACFILANAGSQKSHVGRSKDCLLNLKHHCQVFRSLVCVVVPPNATSSFAIVLTSAHYDGHHSKDKSCGLGHVHFRYRPELQDFTKQQTTSGASQTTTTLVLGPLAMSEGSATSSMRSASPIPSGGGGG